MKKLLAFLLTLMLFVPAALAEFDTASLKANADLYAFTIPGTVNTVYRPVNQPYLGQVDEAWEGELIAYVDYVTLVDEDVTLLRLVVSTTVFDLPLNAEQLRFTVGGKRYTFTVSHEESEYDGLYMEDFTACLTDASLPFLKAVAQQKTDAPIPVELLTLGETVFSGVVVIPGEEAARLYDRYIDLGGKKQDLKRYDETWPCSVK